MPLGGDAARQDSLRHRPLPHQGFASRRCAIYRDQSAGLSASNRERSSTRRLLATVDGHGTVEEGGCRMATHRAATSGPRRAWSRAGTSSGSACAERACLRPRIPNRARPPGRSGRGARTRPLRGRTWPLPRQGTALPSCGRLPVELVEQPCRRPQSGGNEVSRACPGLGDQPALHARRSTPSDPVTLHCDASAAVRPSRSSMITRSARSASASRMVSRSPGPRGDTPGGDGALPGGTTRIHCVVEMVPAPGRPSRVASAHTAGVTRMGPSAA